MQGQSPSQRGNVVLETIAVALSLVAIVFTGLSYFREPARESDKVTVDLIRQVYADFIAITEQRAAHPLQSHLFEVPDNYDAAVTQVRIAVSSLRNSKPDMARLAMEERAVADRIFTMFEQAYYQWEHARKNADTQRETFLLEVLKYYTERLLRNPRLLWYWSASGGKLLVHYEAVTQKYYQDQVQPSSFKSDAVGPY